jgi:hypothetical protein
MWAVHERKADILIMATGRWKETNPAHMRQNWHFSHTLACNAATIRSYEHVCTQHKLSGSRLWECWSVEPTGPARPPQEQRQRARLELPGSLHCCLDPRCLSSATSKSSCRIFCRSITTKSFSSGGVQCLLPLHPEESGPSSLEV